MIAARKFRLSSASNEPRLSQPEKEALKAAAVAILQSSNLHLDEKYISPKTKRSGKAMSLENSPVPAPFSLDSPGGNGPNHQRLDDDGGGADAVVAVPSGMFTSEPNLVGAALPLSLSMGSPSHHAGGPNARMDSHLNSSVTLSSAVADSAHLMDPVVGTNSGKHSRQATNVVVPVAPSPELGDYHSPLKVKAPSVKATSPMPVSAVNPSPSNIA